jgi:hypothetical protein
MRIVLTLREIFDNDLSDKFGLNPYCINEGADPDTEYEAEYSGDIDWNKIRRKKNEI